MTERNAVELEAPNGDALKVWTDPVCSEYAVDELTAAGGPGLTDSGVLS
ncbi:hypothetical protein [Sphingomonas suaedae]|nr:hypothetical protein [Sphingomonas suaedae]